MSDQKQIVAVVDDDASMKQSLERLLNAAGFQAHTFPSAEALLRSNAVADADCLILDVHLPGLSGFELYQSLIQSGAARPVIFISAYDEPDSQRQARDAGAIAFITKPFQGQDLIAAIGRALGDGSKS
jgi:FixJ family two-component response regulator